MLQISIWYGTEQYFGHAGIAQTAINVLGRVAPAKYIAELSYELNGDLPRKLSWGPDYRRLAHPGDFNAEIDTADLMEGANTLRITAVDRKGGRTVEEVVIHFRSGISCRLPYIVDWNNVAKIQDVAQVIDGLWGIDGGQVRTLVPGYDRVIGLGDISWRDFEVKVQITIHGYDMAGVNPISVGFNVGLALRWRGHADWNGSQPRHGYYPVGALALYEHNINNPRDFHLKLYGNKMIPLTDQATDKKLAAGVSYVFKASVRSRPDSSALYRMKVWEASEPEPERWDLEGPGFIGEHDTGSLLLLAHHTDASFGKISVTPL